jgi:hypothetical protein
MTAWLCCLTLCACASSHALKADPFIDETAVSYDRHLEYPIFKGGVDPVAGKLNRFVKDKWAEDRGCGSWEAQQLTGSHYQRTMTAVHVGAALVMLTDTTEYVCPDRTHPDSSAEQYLVLLAKVEPLELWPRLSTVERERLTAEATRLGAHRHAHDPCHAVYAEPIPADLKVTLNETGAALEPRLPWPARACTEKLELPSDELKRMYEGDADVLRALDELFPGGR